MKKFVEKIKKICEENNKVGMFIDMDGTINEYTLYSDATILKQMSDNYSSTEPILSVIETLEEISKIPLNFIIIIHLIY